MNMDTIPLFGEHRTIQERFYAYHEAHPEVWRLFQEFAVERLRRGFRHYSADAILHRVRWECDAVTRNAADGPFKLNDHFSSRYARLLMERDARFAGFFELRELRTA